ncbi:hypothetical protein BC938DRAFT_478510, partial [Jimgerdemannia flammicorona]
IKPVNLHQKRLGKPSHDYVRNATNCVTTSSSLVWVAQNSLMQWTPSTRLSYGIALRKSYFFLVFKSYYKPPEGMDV